MEDEYLLLKWGSLKDWSRVKNSEGKKLITEWLKLGVSASAMLHKDNKKQKEIICKIIDTINGKIQNDWDGEFYTKKQAKEYVMGYDNEQSN